MLRCRPLRCGHRRHRLDALALAWHHQANAVIPQRTVFRPGSGCRSHRSEGTRLLKVHCFNDEVTARGVIEKMRWPKGPVCVFCESNTTAASTDAVGGIRQCRACKRIFRVSSGTILEGCSEPLFVWLKTAYVLSSTAYREVAFIKLPRDTRASADSIEQMWTCVSRASRRYKGYKHPFGKMIQREMTVTSLPLWTPGYSAAKLKLLSQGEHQSQNTIEATGLLRKAAPARLPKLALDRTECLMRLLLATPYQLERKL